MKAKEKIRISINENLCKRCGICSEFCSQKVFLEQNNGMPQVTVPENCIVCHLCDWRCPDFAITLEVIS